MAAPPRRVRDPWGRHCGRGWIPMVMRRRPLLRGAMMAGAGAAVYHAGKQHEAREQEELDQEQVADTSPAPEDEAPPEAAASTGTADELERLKELRDEGALTQAE